MQEVSNIVSLSGGKDSTAMLLMMLEKKISVDHIVFFDTGWEFPGMIKHIDKLEKYIGREIVKLKYKIPFNEAIKKWGFASFKRRWCTDRKVKTIETFCKKYKPFTKWIGFSYDERQRIKRTIGYCYPLIDWKITEEDALKYCYKKGFDWSGLYKYFRRVSCWCCPLQPLKELKALWMYFPEYWQALLKMQEQSSYQFRLDYTLEQLDERFRREESHYQLDLKGL
jgi:3'-phosphoadenosine 5'-phosphosulfate sulfotransferase (PAPS reductase)/FAD synthetase